MRSYSKALTGAMSLAFAAALAMSAQAQTVPSPTQPSPGATPPSPTTTGPTLPTGPNPVEPTATTPEAGVTPLADVENARTAVVGAKVKDGKGDLIGEVKAVEVGPDGKVASINVKVGSRTVKLQSEGLNFAQADKTVVTTQTKAEIQKLPPT